MSETTINGLKFRKRATGAMTFDAVTGTVTFDVAFAGASPEYRVRGAGLFNDAEKSIGMTTYNGFNDPNPTPLFTGTALFFGKFRRGRAKYSAKITAVGDGNGTAPDGYTYVVGKFTAIRR